MLKSISPDRQEQIKPNKHTRLSWECTSCTLLSQCRMIHRIAKFEAGVPLWRVEQFATTSGSRQLIDSCDSEARILAFKSLRDSTRQG